MADCFFLGVETSTTNCSVALIKDEELIDSIEYNNGYSHSEKLAVSVESILNKNKLGVQDLSAIGVGVGPGSYTGLRIGVSFVKGLAFAHQLPVVSFTSTELLFMANFQSSNSKKVVSMLDARRMEAYCQVFEADGTEQTEIFAEVFSKDSFSNWMNENDEVSFIGTAVEKFKTIEIYERAEFIADVFPSACSMSAAIKERFDTEKFEDLAYFEPYYLKEFVAGKPKRLILSPE